MIITLILAVVIATIAYIGITEALEAYYPTTVEGMHENYMYQIIKATRESVRSSTFDLDPKAQAFNSN